MSGSDLEVLEESQLLVVVAVEEVDYMGYHLSILEY